MSKKSKTILCAVLWIIIAVCAVACATKDHEPTDDELAAAEVTAASEETTTEAETTTPEPTTEEPAAEEVTDADTDNHPADSGSADGPGYQQEAPSYEEQEQEAEETEVHTAETDADGRYQFTDDEIWEMTRIVYLENGITYPECTYTTVYLTACVILNRLYDWEECSTVYEVIWEPGQYSTANRYNDYNGSGLGSSNPDGWDASAMAVYEAISDCDRNPHFQSMGAQGTVYYTDPNTGEVFCY